MLRPAFALALLAACEPVGPEQHPVGSLRYPLGLAVEPAGRYAFVANTNFDSRFAGGTVTVVDLEEGRVLPRAISTAAYAGQLVGRADAQGHFDRVYVPTREDGVLRWFSTEVSGDDVVLDCGAEALPGVLGSCDGAHTLGGAGLDPFGIALSPDNRRLYTAAFSGQMGVFDLDDDGVPLSRVQADAPTGMYGVAVHPRSQGDLVYATSKLRNVINAVRVTEGTDPAQAPVVSFDEAVVISSPLAGREFARNIAFAPSGDLAFVAYRGPPASLEVVSTAADASGNPANTLLGGVGLPDSPSGLAVVVRDGRIRVYVSLFATDRVAVVDPLALRVVDLIDVGDGPFEVGVGVSAGRQVLAVTLFNAHALALVDIEPGSPFEHREIKRIR